MSSLSFEPPFFDESDSDSLLLLVLQLVTTEARTPLSRPSSALPLVSVLVSGFRA